MRRLLILGVVLGLATSAWAQLGIPQPLAFTTITVLPMATRSAGPFGFSNIAVPTGVQGAQATMDISQAADPLPTISATFEGSLDGGTTWISVGGFENVAGPKGLNKQGQPKTVLTPSWGGGPFWAATENPNRQLRGGGTLGGTLRFSLTVTPI